MQEVSGEWSKMPLVQGNDHRTQVQSFSCIKRIAGDATSLSRT